MVPKLKSWDRVIIELLSKQAEISRKELRIRVHAGVQDPDAFRRKGNSGGGLRLTVRTREILRSLERYGLVVRTSDAVKIIDMPALRHVLDSNMMPWGRIDRREGDASTSVQ